MFQVFSNRTHQSQNRYVDPVLPMLINQRRLFPLKHKRTAVVIHLFNEVMCNILHVIMY
jgi:hypothetical protein